MSKMYKSKFPRLVKPKDRDYMELLETCYRGQVLTPRIDDPELFLQKLTDMLRLVLEENGEHQWTLVRENHSSILYRDFEEMQQQTGDITITYDVEADAFHSNSAMLTYLMDLERGLSEEEAKEEGEAYEVYLNKLYLYNECLYKLGL